MPPNAVKILPSSASWLLALLLAATPLSSRSQATDAEAVLDQVPPSIPRPAASKKPNAAQAAQARVVGKPEQLASAAKGGGKPRKARRQYQYTLVGGC